jgi:hypothetical protein
MISIGSARGGLNLRRRAGGGIDETKIVVVKRFECFQHLEQRKLRKMEKIDLADGQTRILKLTGWTIMVGMNTALCVEKIDE